MANRNHLQPKSITDRNGKRTTVYTATGAASSSPEVAAKLKKRQETNVAAAAARAAGPAYRAAAATATATPKAERVDGRGFRDDGTHIATGTRFDAAGYDARGWNTSGIHYETGTRFGPHGIDSRGFTELGDNLFTNHGEFDANGYDFDGWREDGRNAYTGEPWNKGGLLRSGDSVAVALSNNLPLSSTTDSRKIDYTVQFVDGHLDILVRAENWYDDRQDSVWCAISDPERIAVSQELEDWGLEGVEEPPADALREIAARINAAADSEVGGLTDDLDSRVDSDLQEAWGYTVDPAEGGLGQEDLPARTTVRFDIPPINLVTGDDVFEAWLERHGLSIWDWKQGFVPEED